jgi:hypothetical protein
MNKQSPLDQLAVLIRCQRLLALWFANAPYTIGFENQAIIDFKGIYRDFKEAYGISAHDLEQVKVAGDASSDIRKETADLHRSEPHHKRLELPFKLMETVAASIERDIEAPNTAQMSPGEKRLVKKLKLRLKKMDKIYH